MNRETALPLRDHKMKYDNKLVTPQNCGVLDDLLTFVHNEQKLPSLNELHKVFPEAKVILPLLIKEDKRALKKIKKLQEEVRAICLRHIRQPKHLDIVTAMALSAYGHILKQQELEERIKTNERILANYTRSKQSNRLDASDARQVPLTNFLEISQSGFAKCPLHGEKTASLKYYPKSNSFYCFGCHAGGDVITFIQQLHKVDFKQALNILSK